MPFKKKLFLSMTFWLHGLHSQALDASVSVHLALLLIADRLADERGLDVAAEIGP